MKRSLTDLLGTTCSSRDEFADLCSQSHFADHYASGEPAKFDASDMEFASIVEPASLQVLVQSGSVKALVTSVPTYRFGIDPHPGGTAEAIRPSVQEMAALEDPQARAIAIQCNIAHAETPEERALVLSVKGTCWVGEIVQARLEPPVRQPLKPKRKRKSKPKPAPYKVLENSRPPQGNLFEAFES